MTWHTGTCGICKEDDASNDGDNESFNPDWDEDDDDECIELSDGEVIEDESVGDDLSMVVADEEAPPDSDAFDPADVVAPPDADAVDPADVVAPADADAVDPADVVAPADADTNDPADVVAPADADSIDPADVVAPAVVAVADAVYIEDSQVVPDEGTGAATNTERPSKKKQTFQDDSWAIAEMERLSKALAALKEQQRMRLVYTRSLIAGRGLFGSILFLGWVGISMVCPGRAVRFKEAAARAAAEGAGFSKCLYSTFVRYCFYRCIVCWMRS